MSRLEMTPIVCFVELTPVSIRTVVPLRANENRTTFRAPQAMLKDAAASHAIACIEVLR